MGMVDREAPCRQHFVFQLLCISWIHKYQKDEFAALLHPLNLLLQVIDVENGSLNNVITFPPDGAFIVDSSLDVADDQRTTFKFRGAQLKLSKRSISLPPFGQGW